MTLADEAVVRATAHRYRGWFTFLGILLIISGALAIAFPLAGSLTVTVWAAVAFLIAGVSQTLHAFMARDWSGFWLGLLIGLLYLATGIVLALYPINGVIALTLFLAAVLLVDGVFRSILAFQIRPHRGWGWMLAGGILGIVLAGLIYAQLPSSAAWVLGLLLGINLVMAGASFLALTWGEGATVDARMTPTPS